MRFHLEVGVYAKKKRKKILNEIKTIIQQKPFDYEKAENLISELNLEEAPTRIGEHLTS